MGNKGCMSSNNYADDMREVAKKKKTSIAQKGLAY